MRRAPPLPPPPHPPAPRQDWGEAPATTTFYGRQNEQDRLRRWLGEDRHRLVAVLGMGGMGKTTLVARVARAIAGHFDFVFWRSLLNAPPMSDILRQALQFLSHQQLTQLPESISEQMNMLFERLRQHRCLLVLDNTESILEAGQAGQYRSGYEGYGQLVERMAQSEHQSCLVLTSRERPRGVGRLEEDLTTVRVLALGGLAVEAGRALLQARGLEEGAHLAADVVARYSGNPLALKLVARTIDELFDGDVAAFLSDEALIFDDIRSVLDQQFARLNPLERDLLVWLAIEREAVSLQRLIENLVRPPSRRDLLETLRSLQRRSLLERSEMGFTLQNVVTEYLTDHLVDRVCQEIERELPAGSTKTTAQKHDNSAPRIADSTFNCYALFKAQAKEYIRQSQVRLIVQPLTDLLVAKMGETVLVNTLKRILKAVQAEANGAALDMPGYAGGNILNLLLHLGVDLAGHDFSNICVWQAYLRGVHAPEVNFAGADLAGSAFTHRYGFIQGLHFRPDGELLVIGIGDHTARVWSAATGEEIFAFPSGDTVHNFICLHPDNHTAALGAANHAVAIVDLADGRLLHMLYGHQSPIWRLVFSADGKWAASSDTVGDVCLWDTERGVLTHHFRSHTAPVTALAFSPPGAANAFLVTGAVDGEVCLWDLANGGLVRKFQAHREEVAVLQFTLDGATFVTGSHDHTVCLWRVADGERTAVLHHHHQPVRLMAIAPNGHLLATGGGDTFIALWDGQTGQMRHILADQAAPCLQLAFSHDSQQIAALDTNEMIHIWDVASGRRLDCYAIYHNGVQAVAFSADGQRIASAGRDPTVYIWDVSNPAAPRVGAQLSGHAHRINSAVLNADGKTAASGDQSGELRLWNLHTGASRKLPAQQGSIMALAFDPTGRTLASAGADGTIQLWDIATGQLRRLLRGHTNVVMACEFSPDGRWLASSGVDPAVHIWEVENGSLLHTMRRHTNTVQDVCFLPDGRVISCSYDQTLRLWDAERGELLTTWSSPDTTYLSLAAHPNGLLLAAGSFQRFIHLIELATGRLLCELTGHSRTVESVTFRPDGRFLVSASHDETIRLWDVEAALAGAGEAACLAVTTAPGPYDGMNITGVTGISAAQKAALIALGAVDDSA
ncbi:MAG: hypothetical protein DCC55_19620 [Chloroflexi bacterium]|nr:MAG: hypothetical protein DCC55_19620 [Chloroflexota bacterium]